MFGVFFLPYRFLFLLSISLSLSLFSMDPLRASASSITPLKEDCSPEEFEAKVKRHLYPPFSLKVKKKLKTQPLFSIGSFKMVPL
ncbi:MAG TPA: hypothetical protein DD412_08530 [Holosporales bacterium]|nr:hypothetical protein [Holosporales bacterium]